MPWLAAMPIEPGRAGKGPCKKARRIIQGQESKGKRNGRNKGRGIGVTIHTPGRHSGV